MEPNFAIQHQRTLLADNATVSVEGPSSSPSNNRLIPIASTVSTESNATSLVGGNATSGLNCAPEKKISPVNATSTGANVDVAVLDTGISLSHPDLNVYRHVSFIDGVTSGDDDVGHGSHIAGIIGAKDNSIGVVGIVPDARLRSIKVCDSAGDCKVSNQIKGIEYAIEHADEIDVLNLSIENPNSPALNSAIDAAVNAGITVIASAGNRGADASQTTPANNPNVLTVSAIGDSDGKCGGVGEEIVLKQGKVSDDGFAFFSNFGPAVKIAAPGVNIFSTYNGTGYAVDSGTSMAAPHVSGAAALYKLQNPTASPSQS